MLQVRKPPGSARTLAPALIASIAYMDPGNFGVNVSAGASYGYSLVWVVVLASVMATLVQYLSAKLGQATERSLAENCRSEYGTSVRIGLWLQAELVVLMTDLAELVGGAIALHLLFGLSLPAGAVITAVASFGILGLRLRGHQGFQPIVIAMLAVIVLAFTYQLFTADVEIGSAMAGLVPSATDQGGALLAVGIVGATVMPHAVYLHSALSGQESRLASHRVNQRAVRSTRRSVMLAMGIAALVNISIVLVSAARLPAAAGASLEAAYTAFSANAGQITAVLFGVALLTSGLASTTVGIFTGQVVMQGYLNRSVSLWLRRAISIVPPLVLLLLGFDATQALILSQVVLGLLLPLTLIPLIRLSARPRLMRELVNRRTTTILAMMVAAVIIGLDAYLLTVTFL